MIWPFVVRTFAHAEHLRALTDSGIQMDSGFFMLWRRVKMVIVLMFQLKEENYEEDSLSCV